MGQRFNPQPIARYDQSLLPTLNQNFSQLSRLLANIPTEFIGSTAPENPYTGQMWVDTNTWTIRVWDGSAWKPGSWTPYTTVSILQSVTITRTLSYSSYEKIGQTVKFHGLYGLTSTGTSGQGISCSLPFPINVIGNRAIGSGYYYNGGVTNIPIMAYASAASTISFMRASDGVQLGVTAGEQVLNGKALTFNVEYEATS